jgi:small subunit ribosomal protein S2
MKRLPGPIFIIDPHRERIAVTEANKLEIPLIGTGDTNVDPDELTFVVPANDDAIRSIRLLCSLVADAAIEGMRERASRAAVEPEPEIEQPDVSPEESEAASEELVAALAGGAALIFSPDEDDLLPAVRGAAAAAAAIPEPPAEATPDEIAAELAREASEKAETDDVPAPAAG